ncbi:hypothetical protein [Burkholderia cepacia]|uniref:hypothetical protein n=1 Tax=Burkholderia cepacia TaxID=292 RepID=UPI00158D6214|nr:hypothetical protein [Burkholderia cepacia]
MDEATARRALEAYYGWRIEAGDGEGVFTIRALHDIAHGTARTRTRFAMARYTPGRSPDSLGAWAVRTGIRYLETRAVWRPVRTAHELIEVRAFTATAIERIRAELSAAEVELRDRARAYDRFFVEVELAVARVAGEADSE